MEIEKEIKLPKFKNQYQKILANITFTSNWIVSKYCLNLKPYKISLQQYNILRILRAQYPKPATVNLLIGRMLDKSSNASRLVEKLRLKKLVERAVSADDRRSVNVAITQKGLDLLIDLDKCEDKCIKELKNLSIKEIEQLNALLDKLRN